MSNAQSEELQNCDSSSEGEGPPQSVTSCAVCGGSPVLDVRLYAGLSTATCEHSDSHRDGTSVRVRTLFTPSQRASGQLIAAWNSRQAEVRRAQIRARQAASQWRQDYMARIARGLRCPICRTPAVCEDRSSQGELSLRCPQRCHSDIVPAVRMQLVAQLADLQHWSADLQPPPVSLEEELRQLRQQWQQLCETHQRGVIERNANAVISLEMDRTRPHITLSVLTDVRIDPETGDLTREYQEVQMPEKTAGNPNYPLPQDYASPAFWTKLGGEVENITVRVEETSCLFLYCCSQWLEAKLDVLGCATCLRPPVWSTFGNDLPWGLQCESCRDTCVHGNTSETFTGEIRLPDLEAAATDWNKRQIDEAVRRRNDSQSDIPIWMYASIDKVLDRFRCRDPLTWLDALKYHAVLTRELLPRPTAQSSDRDSGQLRSGEAVYVDPPRLPNLPPDHALANSRREIALVQPIRSVSEICVAFPPQLTSLWTFSPNRDIYAAWKIPDTDWLAAGEAWSRPEPVEPLTRVIDLEG